MTIQQGWQCPACKLIYAPTVKCCGCCANGSTIHTHTHTDTQNALDEYFKKFPNTATLGATNQSVAVGAAISGFGGAGYKVAGWSENITNRNNQG